MPGVAEYLREVTWVWTLFFAVNVVFCALLPASPGKGHGPSIPGCWFMY